MLRHSLRAEIRVSHWFSTNVSGYPTALERTGDFSNGYQTTVITNLIRPLATPGIEEHANEASFLLGFSF